MKLFVVQEEDSVRVDFEIVVLEANVSFNKKFLKGECNRVLIGCFDLTIFSEVAKRA